MKNKIDKSSLQKLCNTGENTGGKLDIDDFYRCNFKGSQTFEQFSGLKLMRVDYLYWCSSWQLVVTWACPVHCFFP